MIRVLYVHNFLIAKAWHTVHIFPPPVEYVRQLNTAITWHFIVPLSTLQRPKEQGGWGLMHVAAKSRTLILYRLRIQGQKTGTLTAEWLRAWDLLKPSTNPPNRDWVPASMEYLRLLSTDSAYVATLGQTESTRAYKRGIYDTIHTLLRATKKHPDMCITRLWPDTDWTTVWKNLQTVPVPGITRAIK
jgi:hypothetical protein